MLVDMVIGTGRQHIQAMLSQARGPYICMGGRWILWMYFVMLLSSPNAVQATDGIGELDWGLGCLDHNLEVHVSPLTGVEDLKLYKMSSLAHRKNLFMARISIAVISRTPNPNAPIPTR